MRRVNYDSHSLKEYTEGSEVKLKLTVGKIIKSNCLEGRQEYINHHKTEQKRHDKSVNGLRQTEEQATKETWQKSGSVQ